MKTKPSKDVFDVIVIGAGSGGLTAAVGLARFDKQVALIEAADMGGDCTNVGCIPSKTLLHAAREMTKGPGPVDTRPIFEHVRKIRDDLRDHEVIEFGSLDNIELIAGRARLISKSSVEIASPVGEPYVLSAQNIVVATGSLPVSVEIPGLEPSDLLTNQSLFEIDHAPDHLMIIGGGPIAIEMATAFADLGSKVTIVEQGSRILNQEIPEVAEIVIAALTERGISVHTGTTVSRYDSESLAMDLSDGTSVDGVTAVLSAVGRTAKTDRLGLSELGVTLERGSIVIDSWGRTNVDGVWAVGDATTASVTTHGANATGRRIVRAIAFSQLPKLSKTSYIPAVTFSRPEIASVGLDPDELERRWSRRSRLRLRSDFADTDRGLTDQVAHGAVIVDVERFTGKLLRATVVGPSASEMIGIFTLALDQKTSMHKLFTMVHPYPTFAWAINDVTDEFTGITLKNAPREFGAWFVGLLTRIWPSLFRARAKSK